MEGCSSIVKGISSVQVIYGVWKDGLVTDEIGLNVIGSPSGTCQSIEIDEDDCI